MLKANGGGESSPLTKELDGNEAAMIAGADLAQMNVSSMDENLDKVGTSRLSVADEDSDDDRPCFKTIEFERDDDQGEERRCVYDIPEAVVRCKVEEDKLAAGELEEDHSKASVVKIEKDVEQTATASAIVQQTPIDLSNKSVASEETNEENNAGE